MLQLYRRIVDAHTVRSLRKHMLLQGLDAVGLTLKSAGDIKKFEQKYLHEQPWLA